MFCFTLAITTCFSSNFWPYNSKVFRTQCSLNHGLHGKMEHKKKEVNLAKQGNLLRMVLCVLCVIPVTISKIRLEMNRLGQQKNLKEQGKVSSPSPSRWTVATYAPPICQVLQLTVKRSISKSNIAFFYVSLEKKDLNNLVFYVYKKYVPSPEQASKKPRGRSIQNSVSGL